MISEEEKKAIEYFKYQIELAHKEVEERKNDEFKGQGTLEEIAKMRYCNYKIILNLIEKQNKKIEKLENKNKELLRKLRNRVKEVKKLNKYSLYKNEFSNLNKIIKEKEALYQKALTDLVIAEKMIDEMASEINTLNGYLVNEYENFDIDYYNSHFDELNNSDDKIAENAIKEYFKKKIEENLE